MIKNIVKRLTCCIIVAVIAISALISPVNAEELTSQFESKYGTAEVWISEPTKSLTSTQQAVYGGDAGVYFYQTSVGLQASFVEDQNRKAYVYAYEKDTGSNTLFRQYIMTFSTQNGVYAPYYVSNVFTSSELIENESTLELRIYIWVSSVTGDTSQYIPAGLVRYKYWAY